jgi:UDP-glucose 4-epimerase
LNAHKPSGLDILVTGGAGFIGSNVVDFLLNDNRVTVVDNLRNVDERFIRKFMGNRNFKFLKVDITDREAIASIPGHDLVVHLAANSDVRGGSEDPVTDFRINSEGTVNILEYMRKRGVPRIMFASSSTVYGEAKTIPTPETYGPYLPISTYGASKMAAEGFISAYSHYYGLTGLIFRFANIVGTNSTHGVIFDFINKLKKNHSELEILGDGTQRKSYLHVNDCVGAMFHVNAISKQTDIYNLGNTSMTSVRRIAEYVTTGLKLGNVNFRFAGGIDGRGWKGDVKVAQLGIEKLSAAGWKNRYSSDEAVEVAVTEAISQIGAL